MKIDTPAQWRHRLILLSICIELNCHWFCTWFGRKKGEAIVLLSSQERDGSAREYRQGVVLRLALVSQHQLTRVSDVSNVGPLGPRSTNPQCAAHVYLISFSSSEGYLLSSAVPHSSRAPLFASYCIFGNIFPNLNQLNASIHSLARKRQFKWVLNSINSEKVHSLTCTWTANGYIYTIANAVGSFRWCTPTDC